VWAVWTDGAAWFSTGGRVKIANLAADPRCTLTTESTTQAVIVEGVSTRLDTSPAAVAKVYEDKYDLAPPGDSPVYRVDPVVVFGFIDDMERFGTTATRWTF
jgi:hypothetical protein